MTATASYVEQDCTFTFHGRAFEAGGAVVTDQWAIAYPGEHGILTDWHGAPIGTWRAVASWAVFSHIGSRMYQIEAKINGVTYTGRGFGRGMIWRGKRKAQQPRPHAKA